MSESNSQLDRAYLEELRFIDTPLKDHLYLTPLLRALLKTSERRAEILIKILQDKLRLGVYHRDRAAFYPISGLPLDQRIAYTSPKFELALTPHGVSVLIAICSGLAASAE